MLRYGLVVLVAAMFLWGIGASFSVLYAWLTVARNTAIYGFVTPHHPPLYEHEQWWREHAPERISGDLRLVEDACHGGLRMRLFIAVASGEVDFTNGGYVAESTPDLGRPSFDRAIQIRAGWPQVCVEGVRFEYEVTPQSQATSLEGVGLASPIRYQY